MTPRLPPEIALLLKEARRHADGLELLEHAPIETASIVFGFHPFVVEDARRHLLAAHDGLTVPEWFAAAELAATAASRIPARLS